MTGLAVGLVAVCGISGLLTALALALASGASTPSGVSLSDLGEPDFDQWVAGGSSLSASSSSL